jgi:hypothetical protein
MEEPWSLERRKVHVEEISWVTPLGETSKPCDGVKWNQVALRDIHQWGPRDDLQPPRGILEKARCKNTAAWHIRLLRKTLNHDGVHVKVLDLCRHHLMSEMYSDMAEEERYERWLQKAHPELLAEEE